MIKILFRDDLVYRDREKDALAASHRDRENWGAGGVREHLSRQIRFMNGVSSGEWSIIISCPTQSDDLKHTCSYRERYRQKEEER